MVIKTQPSTRVALVANPLWKKRLVGLSVPPRAADLLRAAAGTETGDPSDSEQRGSPLEGGVKFFRQRQVQAAAYEWKREREWQLRTEIEIEVALLHNLRTQLAEFRRLEGESLALRFLCESPEELERTMRGKRTWLELEEVKAVWCWSKHPEKQAA